MYVIFWTTHVFQRVMYICLQVVAVAKFDTLVIICGMTICAKVAYFSMHFRFVGALKFTMNSKYVS